MDGVEYIIPEVMTEVERSGEAQKNVAYGKAGLKLQENIAYVNTNLTAYDSGLQYSYEYI